MCKLLIVALSGLISLSAFVSAEETPEIRSVAVMLNNGEIKLGYFQSDYTVDDANNVQIAKHEQGILNFFELYKVPYPDKLICKYSEGPISLSSVTAISLYGMQFDNLSASDPWTVVSRNAIIKFQSKPLAQYQYSRGGGCRVFVVSYNPAIKEKELESLLNTKVMGQDKSDVRPDEIKKLEKDNVYVTWRCWY